MQKRSLLRVAARRGVAKGHDDERVGPEAVHCGDVAGADEGDAEELGDVGAGGRLEGRASVGCRRRF